MLTKYLTKSSFRISLPIFIGLALIFCMGTLNAQSSQNRVRDIELIRTNDSLVTLKITGTRGVVTGNPDFIDNPPRLIYDFQGVILEYNKGRTSKLAVNSGQLDSIGISQFQLNPDIVRIVLYFRSGTRKSLVNATSNSQKDGVINITYSSKGSPIAQPQEKQPISETKSDAQIFSLLHHRLEPDGDVFLLQGSSSFSDPKISVKEKGATLTFYDIHFQIPVDDRNYFVVPVNGSLIEEIEVVNQSETANLFLRSSNSDFSSDIDFNIRRLSGKEIAIEVTNQKSSTDESTKTPFELPHKITDTDSIDYQTIGTDIQGDTDSDSTGSQRISDESHFRQISDEPQSRVVKIPKVHDDSSDKTSGERFSLTKATTEQSAKVEFSGISQDRDNISKAPDEKASELFRVIIGLYYSEAKADDVVKRLARDGYTGHIHTIETSDGLIYRVQAGAFSKRENAITMADELQSIGYSVEIISD